MSPDQAPTILVVDDDTELRETLEDVLTATGYQVATAVNGSDALDYLRRSPLPRAILLDLMMPIMDGWQFLERQARDPAVASIPVLVMTAFGDHKALRNLSDVMIKPVSLDALIQWIDRHLGDPLSPNGPRGRNGTGTQTHD